MLLFVLFVVGLNLKVVIAEYQKLKFEKAPLASGLDGIECAIESYDKELSRGVKVDCNTGTCRNLTEAWFANQTHEDNSTYYKIWMTEDVFEPKGYVASEFPYHFMVGSSVVFYVQLKAIGGSSERFTFNILSTNELCYHVSSRIAEGNIVFNSRLNGIWGSSTFKSNPMTKYNRTYKVEIRVTTTSYDLYLDDDAAPFQVFGHRVAMTTCTNIELHSNTDTIVFRKLQFLYPM